MMREVRARGEIGGARRAKGECYVLMYERDTEGKAWRAGRRRTHQGKHEEDYRPEPCEAARTCASQGDVAERDIGDERVQSARHSKLREGGRLAPAACAAAARKRAATPA